MTPSNILKIKQIISVVLIAFGVFLVTQGVFPKEKELVKKAIKNIENKY